VKPGPGAAGPAAVQRKERSRSEVEALILDVGSTVPEWWSGVTVDYPQTLDLSWPEPPPTKDWDPSRNVGQFIWSVINENPSRWREGVKFLHGLLPLHKDDPAKLWRVLNALATMYDNLLGDHARAAFWWQKALKIYPGHQGTKLALAECYWKVGSRQMAEEILEKLGADFTRNGNVIKLWSDMGNLERALELAEGMAAAGYPDIGYLAAGDACRLAGKYDRAAGFYQKVVDATAGWRDLERNKKRASASLEAIRLFDALDVKKVPDGTYRASSLGYEAPVEIEVTVRAGRITDLRVTSHREKQYYSSLTDMPRRIIEMQSVKGVDAITSATITSEAIINATAKALGGATR
jgi:uncharacterized protein with FMN-binding domain